MATQEPGRAHAAPPALAALPTVEDLRARGEGLDPEGYARRPTRSVVTLLSSKRSSVSRRQRVGRPSRSRWAMRSAWTRST
jgi:hypothetical protein